MPKPRKLRNKLPERTCVNCGATYIPYRSWQKFHSPECRNIYYWKTHTVVQTNGETTVFPVPAVPVQTSQN